MLVYVEIIKKERRLFILKKRYVSMAVAILTFSISVTAFASNDALSKLKDIGKSDQNSSSEILLPSADTSVPRNDLQTVAEIKAELGDKPQDKLVELKAAAATRTDATDYLRLAVAFELTGNNNAAIDSLHNAISLAPTQNALYQELVVLYQSEEPGKISVFVNGDKINFKDGNDEVNPTTINGRTLVPIRKITEKLGAKVEWDVPTLTAKIRLLDTTVQLVQDSNNALVNGQAVPPLEAPATNLKGHIVVPLRFVSEQFNKLVDYVKGENNTTIIFILDKPSS
jgi:hypothetical protein